MEMQLSAQMGLRCPNAFFVQVLRFTVDNHRNQLRNYVHLCLITTFTATETEEDKKQRMVINSSPCYAAFFVDPLP